jgi:DNA-binding transcriptional MerR regulator
MKKFDEYAEWFSLLVEAKKLGMTVEEIKDFLEKREIILREKESIS